MPHKLANLVGSGAMAQKHPKELAPLIAHLRKLPGVGTRTAERFAFELINWPQEHLAMFGASLTSIRDKIPPCPICGCLTEQGFCGFCESDIRDQSLMCITASARDVFAIDGTGTYKGLYHVVENLLSPLDGRHTSTLRLDRIEERIIKNNVKEIILAFDSTLEGDTTALYLKNHLEKPPESENKLLISRLAFGLPMGSSLEYVTEGTLLRSFNGRQTF